METRQIERLAANVNGLKQKLALIQSSAVLSVVLTGDEKMELPWCLSGPIKVLVVKHYEAEIERIESEIWSFAEKGAPDA